MARREDFYERKEAEARRTLDELTRRRVVRPNVYSAIAVIAILLLLFFLT